MSNSPSVFDARDDDRENDSHGAQQPPTLTPLMELMQGDGYRWASLNVVDLDPPTTFPPDVVS